MKAERVYLRINPDLKKKVQEYCDRRHTTISDLVTRFFVRLLEKEQEERKQEAEQI